MPSRTSPLVLCLVFSLVSTPIAAAGQDELEKQIAARLEVLREGSPAAKEKACLELAALGPPALPGLARAHQEAVAAKIDGYMSAIGAARLRIVLENPGDVHAELVRQATSDDGNVRILALQALELCTAPPLETLLELLRSPSPREREAALISIGQSESTTRTAQSQIIERIENDRDQSVRWRAVSVLGRVPGLSGRSLNVLTEAVTDEDRAVQALAVRVSAHQGAAGLPGLLRALENDRLRELASGLIVGLGEEIIPRVVDELLATTADAERAILIRILVALEASGPDVANAVLRLAGVADTSTRTAVLRAAPLCGGDEERIRNALIEGLKSKEPEVIEAAATAVAALPESRARMLDDHVLAAVQRLPKKAVLLPFLKRKDLPDPILLELTSRLNTSRMDEFLSTCTVILQNQSSDIIPLIEKRLVMGRRFRSTSLPMCLVSEDDARVDALLKLVDDENDSVRSSAIVALGFCGRSDRRDVRSAIEKALEDDVLRRGALQALAWMGDEGESLRRKMLRRLDDLEPDEQKLLIQALVKWQPDGLGVTKALSSLAKDEGADRKVRALAAAGLGRGEKGGARRISALADLLDGSPENAAVRSAALFAVTELGDCDEDILEAIDHSLHNGSLTDRIGALAAVRALGPKARPIAVSLSRVFGTGIETLVVAALQASVALGPDIDELATTFGVHATSLNASRACPALEALSGLGPKARIALPYVVVALVHQDYRLLRWETGDPFEDPTARPWRVEAQASQLSRARLLAADVIRAIVEEHPGDGRWVRPVLRHLQERTEGELREKIAGILTMTESEESD